MTEMEGLAYDTGREDGAAVAFGLMGMAEAIRRTQQHQLNLRIWEIGCEAGTHCLGCLEARSEGWPGKQWCRTHSEGAAVAFGLMGMAEAIHDRGFHRWRDGLRRMYERDLREDAPRLKEISDAWSVCDGDGLNDK